MYFNAIAKVISDRIGCDVNAVKHESTFVELGIDSLDTVERRPCGRADHHGPGPSGLRRHPSARGRRGRHRRWPGLGGGLHAGSLRRPNGHPVPER